MPKFNVQDIRNIALCGHGSSGKTTLVDKMLNVTGAVTRPASVDDGTSVCDFDEVEKHHKYSIESAVVHFEHAGKRFNVIDTPGYPDFIGQAIGALRAVETAVIVINAHSGIEVNTRRVFQEAGKAGWGGSSSSTRWTPTTSTSPPCWRAFTKCSARPASRSMCRSAPGTISKESSARSKSPGDRPAR